VYNNKPGWKMPDKFSEYRLRELGGTIAYPMVNNQTSSTTVMTFQFDATRGTIALVKCNKFKVDRTNLLSFEIPREFYLFVDIYCPGIIISFDCFISHFFSHFSSVFSSFLSG
jgi:hypothetical protein